MSIEQSAQSPSFQALVVAFASFGRKIPSASEEKIQHAISTILEDNQRLIGEGVKSFENVSFTKAPASIGMQDDFSRLKAILERALILSGHGKSLRPEDRVSLQQCVQEYNLLLNEFAHHLDIPEQQLRGVVKNLRIRKELEEVCEPPAEASKIPEETSRLAVKGEKPEVTFLAQKIEKGWIPDVEDIQALAAVLALFSKRMPHRKKEDASRIEPPEEKIDEGSSLYVRAQIRARREVSLEQQAIIAYRQSAAKAFLTKHAESDMVPDSHLISEGVRALQELRAQEATAVPIRSVATLRRPLVKALNFVRSSTDLSTTEKKQVLDAVKEYNRLVLAWEKKIFPEEDRVGFYQSMSIDYEAGPVPFSSKLFRVLDDRKVEPTFGETRFVRYMVKYLLGCAMHDVAKTDAEKTGSSPPPFTTADFRKFPILEMVREAERAEQRRVTAANLLRIAIEDYSNRSKKAVGPEKRELEGVVVELKRLEEQLTVQASIFETISSFLGDDRTLSFSTKGVYFDMLNKRIDDAERQLNRLAIERKGGRS